MRLFVYQNQLFEDFKRGSSLCCCVGVTARSVVAASIAALNCCFHSTVFVSVCVCVGSVGVSPVCASTLRLPLGASTQKESSKSFFIFTKRATQA